MAGHSKWHNIKRKKEANDAKKSKIFSRYSRLISVAAKEGGGDPETNPPLRLAVQKAKQENMPKENIDKAIAKGVGGMPGVTYEHITYEGYGPEGVAFIIFTLTENRNRTVAEIKNAFSKFGGSLGAPGSAAYIFDSETHEPTFTVTVTNDESLKSLEQIYDFLEDHDDVQEFYSNLAEE